VFCQADLVALPAASFTRLLRCLNPHLAAANSGSSALPVGKTHQYLMRQHRPGKALVL